MDTRKNQSLKVGMSLIGLGSNRFSVSRMRKQRLRTLLVVALVWCLMMLFLIVFPLTGYPQQMKLRKLEVQRKTAYAFEGDSLVVDELVMSDSAKIILTKQKTFIKANRIVVGHGCMIFGTGATGELGKDGKSFPAPKVMCKPSIPGEAGVHGKMVRMAKTSQFQ